jgi:hypothetical protein
VDDVIGMRKLKDIQYVPSFKRNLVSLPELAAVGHEVYLDADGFTVTKGGRAVTPAIFILESLKDDHSIGI